MLVSVEVLCDLLLVDMLRVFYFPAYYHVFFDFLFCKDGMQTDPRQVNRVIFQRAFILNACLILLLDFVDKLAQGYTMDVILSFDLLRCIPMGIKRI